jgi:toxin ParE1/3/4
MIYKLSKSAANDFAQIFKYSLVQFGEHQAIDYTDELAKHFELLCVNPKLGVDTSSILANTRRSQCQHHNVYYKVLTNRIVIIRVLHSKQDPMTHF